MNETLIMREWRGRVPHNKADEYENVLHATGLNDYAAIPGNRGIWLLRDDDGDLTEFTTLTLWDSFDAIRSFAGDDCTLARYYKEDADYLVDRVRHVRHYQLRWSGPG